ncbi:hypothetical protein ASPBRDRAFT_28765 [Aspergillus brasiliensis CBS 101740]|uniref:Uncharacterized protein n=1 Tax=Aspergillus brasiliensis (strain CBS 101740 / IMI 381727 / IBT 21946) TaxID=767769 RepID=A0A1L9UPH0_ASPBC|nr:hypothetical protein ASPBRDRAFT_28765 [Aspergillus brasiliensis CBS 101740]
MRHQLLTPLTISLLCTTTTAASTIANIHPAFHDTCPPSSPLSPSLHAPHNPSPILQLHEGTCHPIPITSTHVSFDTQIQQFQSPSPNGEDNNNNRNNVEGGGEEGGLPQHCNVTMHEQPGCVDDPFLASTVQSEEFGRWVGSECAEHHHQRPRYPPVRHGYRRGGDEDVDGNGKGNVWVLLECGDRSDISGSGSDSASGDGNGDKGKGGNVHGGMEVDGEQQGLEEGGAYYGDDGVPTQQQQQQQEEDNVGAVAHGGIVKSTPSVSLNGTTTAKNSVSPSSSSVHAAMSQTAQQSVSTSPVSSVHSPLNQTVTRINSTSTGSSSVHAPLNQTVSWKLMPRRRRGRFSFY